MQKCSFTQLCEQVLCYYFYDAMCVKKVNISQSNAKLLRTWTRNFFWNSYIIIMRIERSPILFTLARVDMVKFWSMIVAIFFVISNETNSAMFISPAKYPNDKTFPIPNGIKCHSYLPKFWHISNCQGIKMSSSIKVLCLTSFFIELIHEVTYFCQNSWYLQCWTSKMSFCADFMN